jgi:RNA polymerase subunit RPABC4/transcription elongation factor Spt4
MSKRPGWITYVGRLIVAKVREWLRLFALYRETSALDNRREDLLSRLGKRYHQYLSETRAEPVPAVAETLADLRVVLQRLVQVEELKQQAKQDTYLYLHPELEGGLPEWAAEELASRQSGSDRTQPRPTPSQGSGSAQGGGIEQLPARRGASAGKPVVCECGQALPAGARFCPACGKPAPGEAPRVTSTVATPRKCPNCGALLPIGAEFCPICGGHIDTEVYEM